MDIYVECKMGFCNNKILCENPNNPKKYRNICDNCNYLLRNVTKSSNGTNSSWRYMRGMVEKATHRGKYEVKITADDICAVWPADNKCPVFGFEFSVGEPRINSPSLDRINNNKGYTPDNIQIISDLANKMKQNANDEQLTKFAQWILK